MNQMSRATGSRDGRRIQYGFVCVPMAFSHLHLAQVSSQSTHFWLSITGRRAQRA